MLLTVRIGWYEIPVGSTHESGKIAAAFSSIICECWIISQSEKAAFAAKSIITYNTSSKSNLLNYLVGIYFFHRKMTNEIILALVPSPNTIP